MKTETSQQKKDLRENRCTKLKSAKNGKKKMFKMQIKKYD
jgi:hypothetical protein